MIPFLFPHGNRETLWLSLPDQITAISDSLPEPRKTHTAKWTGNVGVDPHFELSMICCAFLIADSSGALSFFRMSIVFCAEAVASFLLPSFA